MKFVSLLAVSICLIASTVFADATYLFNNYKDTPIYLLADLEFEQLKQVREGVIKEVTEAGFKPYIIGSDEIMKIQKPDQNKIDHYYFVHFTFTDNVMRTSVSCYRRVTIEHKGKKYKDFIPTNQPDVFSTPIPEGSASLDDVISNIRIGMEGILDKVKEANTKQ